MPELIMMIMNHIITGTKQISLTIQSLTWKHNYPLFRMYFKFVNRESAAKKKADEAKKAAAEEKRTEALRNENLKRMQGMAGASGEENSKGTALKASGPAASYAGRIRARIKPNITFTEDMAGNPKAEVEVRTSPDGTIISRKLLSSSGNKAWDEAVLKAIDKTATLPRDEDGRVPPVLEISFRPKD